MMTAFALVAALLLASCGAGGQVPVVLGAPPPPPAPPPAEPPPPEPPTFAAQVGGLTLYGGSGGLAPHTVHVRANVDAAGATWTRGVQYSAGARVESGDGSTVYECKSSHTSAASNEPGVGASWATTWNVYSKTGSGFWAEGRWQFQFCKADGSPLDLADRNWMRVTDPISNSIVYTDDRYGAAPNAAFVFRSAGSYKVRVRYQNRDKDWSAWVDSSPITVAPNTRTKRYVNGSTGSDLNSGISPQLAKATLNAALSLVNAKDFEIEIADGTRCDVATPVDVSGYSGLYIHRSGGGTAPTVVLGADPSLVLGSDSFVDDIVFDYNGSTTYPLATLGASKTNVTLANIVLNKADSLAEISSASFPKGLFLFNCRTTELLTRYTLFAHDVECLSILGCTFDHGSSVEHTVRVSSGNGATTGTGHSKYVTIDFSTLDHAGYRKSAFRCYASHVGVYRSVLAHGAVSMGDQDQSTQRFHDICFDGCKVDFSDSGTPKFEVYENVSRLVVRTSFFKKSLPYRPTGGLIDLSDNSGGGTRTAQSIRLLNLSVHNTGSGDDGLLIYQELTIPATDVLVRGCIWWNDDAEITYQRPFYMGTASGCADGWLFEDCVHSILTDQAQFRVGPLTHTVPEANATVWADGLIEEDHDFDSDGQPLGNGTAWRTAVRASIGVFRSLNGVDWAVAGPAGCWYPASK